MRCYGESIHIFWIHIYVKALLLKCNVFCVHTDLIQIKRGGNHVSTDGVGNSFIGQFCDCYPTSSICGSTRKI